MPKEFKPGFELPVALTGHPLKQVCFAIPDVAEYRRAFWGHVFELARSWKWEQDAPSDTRNQIAAEYWEQLLYSNLTNFIDDPDCAAPQANTCQTYPPTAAFIQWFPNDPVYTPDFVGEGYNNPAWYFATLPSNIAYGSQYGDVITSLDRFPPGSLPDILPASGLPRFRINVNGVGTVKAKLVNMFGGSLIQTTVDDDIGTLNFIDVSRDTVSAPPETNGELEVEINLTTPGAHHIDFIVISWVNASIPFLHHGGGLRSVELCGFDEMPIYSPPFRFTEACGLEFYDGEAWQPVTGWTDFAPDCFTGPAGATLFIRDPGDGQLETSPDNAVWSDVPNAAYVHLNGDIPMTGGLEILGVTDEVKLTIRGVGTPYQTNKLVSFRDADNVERAWINPRGDAVFSGNAAGTRALELANGGIGIDYNKYMWWKDNVGAYRIAFGVGSNVMFFRSFPSGLRIDDSGGNSQMLMDATNLWRFQNTVPTTGVTQFRVKSGEAQGSSALLTLERNDGNSTLTVGDTGNIIARRRGQAVNAVSDVLQLDNRAAVPGGAGLGVNLRMSASSSTQSAREQGIVRTAWDDATDATRKGHMSLIAFDTAEREFVRGAGNGSAATIGFLGATPVERQIIGGDAQGNQLLYDLIAALTSYGLIDITGVTLGLTCCENFEFCKTYDFTLEQYNSYWNYSNGNWVEGFGIGKDAVTGRIDISLLFSPDCDLIEIEMQGTQATAGETQSILVSDNAAHNDPFIDATPPPISPWNVGFAKIGVPVGVPAIYVTITASAESAPSITAITIRGRSSGGIPEGAIDCA